MVRLKDTSKVKSRTRTVGAAGMRVTRTGAGSVVALTAVLGLSLATAGPAAATDAGTWRAYGNTNPITSSSATWHCAASKTVATSVLAQVCAIRSSGGGSVQAAVIVRNNRSSLYSATANMDLYTAAPATYLGDWACASSGVGANSWSVCFGKTLSKPSSVKVNSAGLLNNVELGQSPNV
ncbi:hypothetical protein [Streptomyces sp. WM6386]|uniref:hypothetical protein n=1 Tax=Streptomyces sp. WM6386 TaxID=1415558 RepID=UPI000AC99270|nr:hypothetical protein [Streptomyces sp. WM6386]